LLKIWDTTTLYLALLSSLVLACSVSHTAAVYYPPVSESVERVSSSHEYTQERGISDLVGMGKSAAPAYDFLMCVAVSSNKLPKIRSGAVQALRNIDEARASAQFIQELTNSTPAVREYAADALMIITRPEAAMPLLERLRDDNERVRGRAGIALQFYKDDRLAEALIAALQNKADQARQWAPWLLGRMKRQDAIVPLTNCLGDDVPAFRKNVIAALRDIKSKDAAPALLAVVRQDKDDEVRSRAIQCLGEIGDAFVGTPLLQYLTDPNPEIRASVAGALGMLRVEEAREPLRKMLGGDSPREKLAAMGGLCLLEDLEAPRLIVSSLDRQPPELVPYFMQGLVELNAVAEITSLQSHTNEAVKSAAQKALQKLEKRTIRSSNNGTEPIR
jgi:HEAT repeat protein